MTKRPTRLSLERDNRLLNSLSICQKENVDVIRAALRWRKVIWTEPATAKAEKSLIRACERLSECLAKSRRKS